MKVVDNTASLAYDTLGSDVLFIAAATFGFVTATKILTVTDASTIPAGDTFKRMSVEVFDQKGASKKGEVTAALGNAAIDLDAATSLDLTGPVQIRATIVTGKGLAKDGSYANFSTIADATGALGFEK